ncbi:putative flavin-nucleotide-binding protein [Calycina marina]|uniref:Flavin-nucleotide-binding protein n=1 Tax=Calycina marina TaxID=1763456 RepID=A0A9P7Z4D0_9HELO|nr:putative flavin-nucleotide-binding protein [Calycina marina]
MAEESSYPKLARNAVNRYGKPRGKYDFQTIHTIVNTSPVLHVSFPTPDPKDLFSAIIPMLSFMGSFTSQNAALDIPLDLYLHGYISSRLMRLSSTPSFNEEGDGLPLTIAATHVDGLVLALTPNSHSYNYRSAILHGFATPRWSHSRIPPTKTEMASTQILKVTIVDASAKIRVGPPSDDRADMRNEEVRATTWIGVVPTWTMLGTPVASGGNRVAEVPEHVMRFVREHNEEGERNAVAAVQAAKK